MKSTLPPALKGTIRIMGLAVGHADSANAAAPMPMVPSAATQANNRNVWRPRAARGTALDAVNKQNNERGDLERLLQVCAAGFNEGKGFATESC